MESWFYKIGSVTFGTISGTTCLMVCLCVKPCLLILWNWTCRRRNGGRCVGLQCINPNPGGNGRVRANALEIYLTQWILKAMSDNVVKSYTTHIQPITNLRHNPTITGLTFQLIISIEDSKARFILFISTFCHGYLTETESNVKLIRCRCVNTWIIWIKKTETTPHHDMN